MRWTLKPKPQNEKVEFLAKKLGIQKELAYLLSQRGVETFDEAKDYFRPSLKNLHDPFLMKGMEKAVNRIQEAVQKSENILVYGDYDVDGTTSVALMASYLLTLTSRVATYIPDRYKEGYGISKQGIDFAADNDISLIVALDCGIKAVDQIQYATEKGVDFIICDHHLPGKTIPDAVAILDPKQEDCSYPFDELCGCGVGFKLVQALHTKRGEDFDQLIPFLDLVATAIGADIVPITGENRIMAHYGLKVINTIPRPGFKAIIDQVKKEKLTITDVVFVIAPRINAAGRMDHALRATELLMETDETRAQQLAQEIEVFNADRKNTDKSITEEALIQIEEAKEQNRLTTVVYQEDWHKGVVGIVASRLIETYYRPTLVFTKSGNRLSASARSVKGFNIYNALEACSEHIEQFGGHKYAAGLTMKDSQYKGFKQKFESVVTGTIDKKLLEPTVSIDMKLDLNQITPKFFRILKQFAPSGPGNMRPVFLVENLRDTGYAKKVGEDGKHLKCTLLQDGDSRPFIAIGFNLGDKLNLLSGGQLIDAVFSLEENTWRGKTSLQLKLRDIRE